jgi:branched-chain amino acid transport system permease protein
MRKWAGPGLLAVVVAAVLLLPRIRGVVEFPTFFLVFFSTVLFWAAQATSWNILSGYSGYFSFGQGAFFGVGAYTVAVLVGRRQLDFFLSLPMAGALAVVLALGIGGLAFRLRSLRGEIFALLTLAIPFILSALARINPSIDGGQGIVLRIPEYPAFLGEFQDLMFVLSAAVAILAVITAYVMEHSRTGWALFGIRDAEDVAERLGVPTFRYKMLAISLTGLIAGLAGAVFALQVGFITVEGTFNLTVPLLVIVMSVLGGRNHWLGPTLGALLIVTLQNRLAASGFEGWNLIVLGTILVVLVLLAPEGLISRLAERPMTCAAVFAGTIAFLAVARVWGGFLDWLAAASLVTAVVAFLPARRRPGPVAVGDPAATGVADPVPVPAGGTVVSGHREPPSDRRVPVDEALVVCDQVAKDFGGVHALRGVSLTVSTGELIGLVGPNGSGKTTLVNLMSGAFTPTSGDILFSGRSIVGMPPHRIAHLGVARTYQIPRPFGSMTVRDNVAIAIMFGREPRSPEAARQAAEEHLELVGLQDHADARPDRVNLHARQLLEIARALATRPRVLFLDEALAGLNPVEIDHAIEVVRRVHASGISIVLVEHLLRVVNELATRVVVLDQGSVLADADPATAMADPAVVSAYLGRQAHA